MHDVLDKGLQCTNSIGAIIFFITLTTMLTALVVQVTLAVANPLAAFGVGLVLDQLSDWLISQTPDCKAA
jgi:hypothetical protein